MWTVSFFTRKLLVSVIAAPIWEEPTGGTPLSNQWTPLLDWISLDESNLQGVESIAIDPKNPQNVYIACGTYTSSSNGAILCSYDGGRTFARVDVPFTMGGNENGRGNGERMMVDPQNGNIIYMGTRLHGLWRSTDKGRSWARVVSFPDVSEKFNPADRAAWGIAAVVLSVLPMMHKALATSVAPVTFMWQCH